MPAIKIATGFRPPLLAILILAGFGAAGCSNIGTPLEGETPTRQVQSGRQTPAQASPTPMPTSSSLRSASSIAASRTTRASAAA